MKEVMTTDQNISDSVAYEDLVSNIGKAFESGRDKAVSLVNHEVVRTNWEIGRYIVKYEQAGNEKAEYGSVTLKKLSRDLTDRYGKGFRMTERESSAIQ